MAIPEDYCTALDKHLRIKSGGVWKYVEDVRLKNTGTWEDVKEVYVKSGGTWNLVHEGEHFLFNHQLDTNAENEFDLVLISGQGYSGNKIKGALIINNFQQRVN